MKRFILLLAASIITICCSNNNEGSSTSGDQNKVHPESETIPDSLKLVNDSAIVVDIMPGNTASGRAGDSAKKQRKD
jgi:hypothetical protein